MGRLAGERTSRIFSMGDSTMVPTLIRYWVPSFGWLKRQAPSLPWRILAKRS